MKKTTNKNRTYEAPQLTAVTFKVEQGFATSGFSSPFVHQQDYSEAVTTFGRSGYGDATVENGNQQSWGF